MRLKGPMRYIRHNAAKQRMNVEHKTIRVNCNKRKLFSDNLLLLRNNILSLSNASLPRQQLYADHKIILLRKWNSKQKLYEKIHESNN